MEQMSARSCFLEVSQIWTILGLFLINTLHKEAFVIRENLLPYVPKN